MSNVKAIEDKLVAAKNMICGINVRLEDNLTGLIVDARGSNICVRICNDTEDRYEPRTYSCAELVDYQTDDKIQQKLSDYVEALSFSIDIHSLYEQCGKDLTYCKVTFDSNDYDTTADDYQPHDTDYFDLYSGGNMVCCDGETVAIMDFDGNNVLVLLSDNGEEDIPFKLTVDEFAAAVGTQLDKEKGKTETYTKE